MKLTYDERMRFRELEEREATGESFWTDELPDQVVAKIKYACDDAAQAVKDVRLGDLMVKARDLVVRANGRTVAPKESRQLLSSMVDDPLIFAYVEAVHHLLSSWGMSVDARSFAEKINCALLRHRVKFKFVPETSEIIPLKSMELHISVVEPTLKLLHGKPGFEDAHESYMKALKEISESEPANAITDAGTALQVTLQKLGCSGNKLAPLIKDARKRGLLAAHDEQLAAGITKFMDWASADRSEKGDGHKTGTNDPNDAWLMVHIVGALIVRLAEGTPRKQLDGP